MIRRLIARLICARRGHRWLEVAAYTDTPFWTSTGGPVKEYRCWYCLIERYEMSAPGQIDGWLFYGTTAMRHG